MYRVTQLDGGLRVATHSMPRVESVSFGIWVGVGGRYEPAPLSGVSHFIEHLLFKGTRRRTARQISESVESLGGYLNAFTSEETTCYYAKAAHSFFPQVLDVLTDMYQHAAFDAREIEKERGVIKEEILMYRDQPPQYVHELLGQTMWPDQPLGRSLTGSVETVNRISREEMLRYKQRHYRHANTVISVAGRLWHEDVVDTVAQAFGDLERKGALPTFTPVVLQRQRRARVCLLQKESEQTHIALGAHAYSREHPDRFALRLLSVILGENMSSRLFQVVREQYGLAYSIQSSTGFFADTGSFVVSASMETKRLERALRLVMRELRRIARQPPSNAELERARRYALGQMRLGMESTSNQMMWMGEQLLNYGKIIEAADIVRRIEAITTEDVERVAADLFHNHRWNLALIGPVKDQKKIESILDEA